MVLYDTNEERDVLVKHDVFLGLNDLNSSGICIKITKELQSWHVQAFIRIIEVR
jgi:hypothetical protein